MSSNLLTVIAKRFVLILKRLIPTYFTNGVYDIQHMDIMMLYSYVVRTQLNRNVIQLNSKSNLIIIGEITRTR